MKNILLALVIFILSTQSIFAETTNVTTEDRLLVLKSINFKIDGRSKQNRILSIAGIKENESWQNLKELDLWIKEKTQILINCRELESVELNYDLIDSNISTFVNLIIKVKDSNNIVILPYPEYSSSKGLDLSIRGRDYNFLGLLTPLKINLGYIAEQKALEALDFLDASWYAEMSVCMPFKINNNQIEYSIEQNFNYTEDSVFQSFTENDIHWLIKTDFGSFSASLTEGFYYNDENDDLYTKEYGDYLLGWYFDTNIKVSYGKDLIMIPGLEKYLNLKTSVSFNVKNLPDFSFIGKERAGPVLTPLIGFSVSRIDWHNNLREGFSANLEATFPYNFYFSMLQPVFSVNTTLHHRFFPWFGISSNLFATYRPNTILTSADEHIRGLTNLYTSYGAFLNVDLPFLVSFKPDKLFGWAWTKILSFDLHIAPFTDFAITYNNEDPNFKKNKAFYFCPGIEAIIYPQAFRSLFLRISAGFNLDDPDNLYEIYIGLNHKY